MDAARDAMWKETDLGQGAQDPTTPNASDIPAEKLPEKYQYRLEDFLVSFKCVSSMHVCVCVFGVFLSHIMYNCACV